VNFLTRAQTARNRSQRPAIGDGAQHRPNAPNGSNFGAMGQQSALVRGIEWIILNQLGRRNLPAYERAKLALLLEPIIAAKAKENQRIAAGGDRRSEDFQGLEKSPNLESEPINTRVEVARIASVSDNTIAKVKKIEAKATPEQKQELKNDTVSINEIHKQIKQI
jgi:hypothetical protein